MAPPEPPKAPVYLAFISYAREDEAFARRLESEIEAWPPPRGSGPVRVFRDRSDFTGGAYEAALDRHLADSAALIVLCSPHARRSRFVGDEITRFVQRAGPGRIFPILVDGLPDNEADELKAFPPALLEATRPIGMPLGAEFRGIDLARERLNAGRFEAEWYKLLGNLFDAPAAEVQDLDKRRLVRIQRQRMVAGAALVAVLVVVLAIMAWLWQRAVEAERIAKVMSERAQTELSAALRAPAAEPAPAPGAPSASGAPPAPASEAPGTPATPAGGAARPTTSAGGQPVPAPSADSAASAGPPTAPVPTADPLLKTRVYFHIRDNAQRPSALALKAALERAGLDLVVPGIQRLDVGPTQGSELRYFRDDERSEAEGIGRALVAAGSGALVVKKVPGYETSTQIRRRHFELWLKPAAGAAGG